MFINVKERWIGFSLNGVYSGVKINHLKAKKKLKIRKEIK
jgi:hypothetical protein